MSSGAAATSVLSRNLAAVRGRIARAAERSGRPAGAVRLVAVTKTVPAEVAAALVRLGVEDLGENRIDGLEAKRSALGEAAGASWHMIGHLQRNKAKRFLDLGALLHALDSGRLADALADRIDAGAPPRPVLVEVNVSGETSKGGVPPDELPDLLGALSERGRLVPAGLMTMAPLSDDPEAARPHFRALRELRDASRERCPALVELSMGMSQDFEVAVEEGATFVRVGSALFEGLPR